MTTPSARARRMHLSSPPFAELFTPKLVTALREGYGLAQLRADALAGLTVAIVALPLSMAIAIASGVAPERGLYTAIIGGALISLLGGSRFQIGGPAGAFIVLIAAIVEREGYDGLVLATLIGGAVMLGVGFFQLGTFIKYIPYPVTVGFTTGIAVIIFTSQLRELLGLDLNKEPAAFLPKVEAIWQTIGTAQPATFALALFTLIFMLALQKWRPRWPSLLIAVTASALIAFLMHIDVATLGTRFGGIPSSAPHFQWPDLTRDALMAKLPHAITNGVAIAFLGAIESLLSAVVADGMTGRRHRSNCELVAQGAANIGSVLFGGICATGTIARTATNIRAGAKTPLSGVFHALYLLLFVLFAAPLIAYVPLAALGAVLALVAWNMAEKREFLTLLMASRGDALVLLATFLLTVFVDLTYGIAVGVVLGAFLFIHRMAEAVEVEGGPHIAEADRSDRDQPPSPFGSDVVSADEAIVYRISGAFFFGAAARVASVLERIGATPKTLILDFSDVPLIDSTGAHALENFISMLERAGTHVILAGARRPIRKALLAAGLSPRHIDYADDVAAARTLALKPRRASAPH